MRWLRTRPPPRSLSPPAACVLNFLRPNQIACSYKSLPTSVQKGSRILVADGSLVLVVKECKET